MSRHKICPECGEFPDAMDNKYDMMCCTECDIYLEEPCKCTEEQVAQGECYFPGPYPDKPSESTGTMWALNGKDSPSHTLVNAIKTGTEQLKGSKEYWSKWVPPPHPTAESHKVAMKRLRNMTPEELLQTSVDAGVHNPDGTLTDKYKDPDD